MNLCTAFLARRTELFERRTVQQRSIRASAAQTCLRS
jgi:hypothetical protein